MTAQDDSRFANALRQVLRDKHMKQAELAERIHMSPSQISRWMMGRIVPRIDSVRLIDEALGTHLADLLVTSKQEYELYVSSPISGIVEADVPRNHAAVAKVVSAAEHHVSGLMWPGERVKASTDLQTDIAELVTEHNMKALISCSAFMYVQFSEVVRPTSAFVELGFALGRNMKITIIVQKGLTTPYMLRRLDTVAARLSFLPSTRMCEVDSADHAASLLDSHGRELLGLG